MSIGRTTLRGVGLLLVALLVPASGCRDADRPAAGAGAPTRAIVLITVDALVGDDLAMFGGPYATPALAALGEEGTGWRDGWTVTPMTRPAVATYLTGVAPDRHGVRDDLFTALPKTIPTLASLLAQRGYRTAAFPGSSFLGFASGLLEGFEVVDDPPAIPVTPARWIPRIGDSAALAGHASAWIRSLPADERYFAWIHVPDLLIGCLTGAPLIRSGDEESLERNEAIREEAILEAVQRFDAAVAAVVAVLRERGQLDDAAVIVAGVSGDPAGGEKRLRGPGFSLDERALSVPVVARFPVGSSAAPAERTVWAPDIAATIAELGGVELAAEAEGVSLLSMPEPRILFAWSWALRDQMGWNAMRAARSGRLKRLEGFATRTISLDDASGGAVDPADEETLARALGERVVPPAPAVPLADVTELLAAHDVQVDPVPAEGRSFGPEEKRVRAALLLWGARWMVRKDSINSALSRYQRVLELDPENLGALLDAGQVMAIAQSPEARTLLSRAASRYPTDPEVVHWFAHALWRDSYSEVEPFLEAILPFKPNDSDVLYDLACIRSLGGDLPAAEEFLRSAVAAGFKNWAHMDTDPDLRNLRESGRFAAVMREIRP